MPKELLKIDKFNLGIVNAVNELDVPEGGLVSVVNLMSDVPGQLRQMGHDKVHDDLNNSVVGLVSPGYGLFAFRSDYRVSDDSANECKVLAFQDDKGISFYDLDSTPNLLIFGKEEGNEVRPMYYYTSIDGALRVCDSNFNNISYEDDNSLILNKTSHVFVKYLKFIDKTWFHEGATYASGTGNDPLTAGFSTHDFALSNVGKGLDAYIYPPTVGATITALNGSVGTTHNLCHQAAAGANDTDTAVTVAHLDGDTHGGANLAIHVTHTDDNGNWIADSAIRFGATIVYEGNQESPVTNFQHTGLNAGSTVADDGYSVDINIYASTIGWDPRVIGVNIYQVGDSTGEFIDPLRLAEFYFGKNNLIGPEIRTSDGDVFDSSNLTIANKVAYNNTAISIKNPPALSFGILNAYSHDVESMSAIYKTAIVTNRRAYIGGVQRILFDVNNVADVAWQDGQNNSFKQPEIKLATKSPELDTIYISVVDKFDIFPMQVGNILDIGSNDGDSIVSLVEYADRLLKFKKNKLYVINLSQDVEYVESEHDYMGISYPYQVTRTARGIVWGNKNGCYLYNEDGIVNLTELKLHKTKARGADPFIIEGWGAFFGDTGMLGYIPVSEQIICFENALAAGQGANSDAFIYDFKTQSWTKGLGIASPHAKSNIVNNYDNTCLYATLKEAGAEEIEIIVNQPEDGIDSFWQLDNVNATNLLTDPDGSQLLIGSTPITDVIHFSEHNTAQNFSAFLIAAINQKVGPDAFEFEFNNGSLKIIRPADLIDGTYTGALSWSTSGSLGPPITSAGSIAPASFEFKFNNERSQITSGQTPIRNQHKLILAPKSPAIVNGIESYLGTRAIRSISSQSGSLDSSVMMQNYVSDTIRDKFRIRVVDLSGGTFDGVSESSIEYDLFSEVGHGFAETYLETDIENNELSILMRHFNAPKTDGTGTIGPNIQANGNPITTNTSFRDGQVIIPSAVFQKNDINHSNNQCDVYRIMIPGDYSNIFSSGDTITISGVESNANSNKDNALNITLKIKEVSGVIVDEDIVEGDSKNYLSVTTLFFTRTEQNTSSQTNDWPYLINWTTFSTISFASSTVATIGSSFDGVSSFGGGFNIIPKRFDAVNNVRFALSIDGQNGQSYFLQDNTIQGTHLTNLSFFNQLNDIRDNEVSKPFQAPNFIQINRADKLLDDDGNAQVTASAANDSTTSLTLSSTINVKKGMYLQFGGSIGTPGNQIVKVTDISSSNTTGITVVRNQLGTTANTISADSLVFIVNVIEQIDSNTIRVYGDNFTQLFTTNALFKVKSVADTSGGNAWNNSNDLYYIVRESTYTEPSSSGNYTTVDLETDTSFHQIEDVGVTQYHGNNSSFYTTVQPSPGWAALNPYAIEDDGTYIFPQIQFASINVPGRLTSNSNLQTLNIGGTVTDTLAIKEFLNTEEFSADQFRPYSFKTKKYSFGDPSQTTKIFKIVIRCKAQSGTLFVKAETDNDIVHLQNTLSEDIEAELSSTFKNYEFNNIQQIPLNTKSLSIQVFGQAKGIVIDNISVVYRNLKGIR